MDETRDSLDRLTTAEAASRLGIEEAAAMLDMTTGAVRSRLSQGTLRSVEEHGTVYVLLPADTSRGTARDTSYIRGESNALVSEMRDRIASLERELEGKDAILRNIAEAMKDISSPPEQPGRPSVLQP